MAKKDKEKKKDGKKDKPAASPQEIAYDVAHVARQFRTLTSRALNKSGLYGGQEGVMLALAETDGLTAGQIAQRLGVKPPTMTRTITRMEAQGFLIRKGADDGRQTTVWLTQAGRDAIMDIESASKNVYEAAFRNMEPKQMRKLQELLQEVGENLSIELSTHN
jgi:DNA-binding MarR family transcriptional regulator